MSYELLEVDAFTDKPFGGNPAAVCFCDEPREAEWMQHVAQELNLSETAFLTRQDGGYDLRWFTPTVEVDLCGHATLASAHALWETGRLDPRSPARFHTRSGQLVAERRDGWIELDFPVWPPESAPVSLPDLAQALGVEPVKAVKCRTYCLVEVASEAVVRAAAPSMPLLRGLPYFGITLTARADTAPFDFVSRFFAPAAGIDEDPVTGSAHCALGPYWGDLLGKPELIAFQASPRGGTLRIRLACDRIKLLGHAVTVWRGHLLAT